jgi:voltage-gated sodium channel
MQKLKTYRQKVKQLIENKSFDLFIMLLICLDALVFGLLTSDSVGENFGGALFILDRLCMAIFIVEMGLKIYVYGTKFFTTHWNTFDFLVILVSAFSSYFIVLRTFRLFRLLKYIDRFSKLKQILRIFNALLPNFMSVLMVFGVFLYVFAIMAVSLFGDVFIEFSTLGASIFSLLQVFTLDGWASEIARPVMSVYPHAWIYFFAFLLISLLLGVSFIMSVIDEIVRRDLSGHRAATVTAAKTITDSKDEKTAVKRRKNGVHQRRRQAAVR